MSPVPSRDWPSDQYVWTVASLGAVTCAVRVSPTRAVPVVLTRKFPWCVGLAPARVTVWSPVTVTTDDPLVPESSCASRYQVPAGSGRVAVVSPAAT